MEIVDLGPLSPAFHEQAAILLVEHFNEPRGWPTIEAAREEVCTVLETGFARALIEEQTLLGWIGGLPEYQDRVWELHPLVVHREYRRRGHGRALLLDAITEGLQAAKVNWVRDSRLVRGLDYYRHTAFEFVTDRLGAQGTVLGGGRYDGLIESLGGPETPAVGWAAGIERLAMLLETSPTSSVTVAVIPMGEAAALAATGIVADFRRAGISADMSYKGNMKKRMQKANDWGARYAVILGDDELARGEAGLKDLATGEQHAVALLGLVNAVAK